MSAGWPTRSLGEVCEVVGGGTPAKDRSEFYGGIIPWATVRDMRSELIVDTEFKITPFALKNSSTNVIPKDNVVIATRVGLGKVCLLKQDTAINQDLRAVIPKNGTQLCVPFLFWWLKSVAHLIVAEGTGATVQGVKLPFIKSLPIPLPSPSEQQRIVGILDEAFVGLATATANAAKNLKNARELFKSYLNAVFANKAVSWKATTLGTETDLLVGFAFKSAQYTRSESGVRLLRGDNVIQNALRWDDVKRWSETDIDKYQRYLLSVGDVVLAMDRTWVAAGLKYAAIQEADMPCLLLQRVARLRCLEQLDSRFLVHLIGSPLFTEYVLGIQTGLSVPHISGKQISDFAFRKPRIEEQRRIGAAMDNMASNVAALEDAYSARLVKLADLKQSLLQKAFSGELTSPPLQAIREAAE